MESRQCQEPIPGNQRRQRPASGSRGPSAAGPAKPRRAGRGSVFTAALRGAIPVSYTHRTGLAADDKILVQDPGLLQAAAAYFDDAHLELLKTPAQQS